MLSIPVSITSFSPPQELPGSDVPEQDQVPEVFQAKQYALSFYSDWSNDLCSYEEVRKAYEQAELICVAYGWNFLENMPFTGNFIPERYGLLGNPRDGAQSLRSIKGLPRASKKNRGKLLVSGQKLLKCLEPSK